MKKFTKSHEWVELTDGIATIGVTNHAQEQLGDIVYVDLREPETIFQREIHSAQSNL